MHWNTDPLYCLNLERIDLWENIVSDCSSSSSKGIAFFTLIEVLPVVIYYLHCLKEHNSIANFYYNGGWVKYTVAYQTIGYNAFTGMYKIDKAYLLITSAP